MAARKNKIRHDEQTRRKIQASQLVNALQNHVFGKRDMTSTQVRAALGLLAKTIPDLLSTTNETEVTHRYVARAPAPASSDDAWQQQHSPAPTIQ